jgi:hypothetical protein
MAKIDKALPNVETEIKVPGEEEILELLKKKLLKNKLVLMIYK